MTPPTTTLSKSNNLNRLFSPLPSHTSSFLRYLHEFFAFGIKQALSCLFPAFIFLFLFVSKTISIPFLPRYDFLLLSCLAIQALMYFTKMETRDELLVITLFHLIGICLEIFKVNVGSWSYPEDAYTKVAGVPLYSGFMYASVASYLCQAWRRFDLQFAQWCPKKLANLCGALIYLNFFTNYFIPDMRWWIIALVFAVFWKTKVLFSTTGIHRSMPLTLSFMLIGFFVWLAENIATFLGAWKYAYQHHGWKMVSYGKISSWFLLVIVSIIIVVELKHFKERIEMKK